MAPTSRRSLLARPQVSRASLERASTPRHREAATELALLLSMAASGRFPPTVPDSFLFCARVGHHRRLASLRRRRCSPGFARSRAISLACVLACVGVGPDRRRRPYRVECTGSLSTSEVKQRRARLVLGWGTAWEDLRVLSAFFARLCFRSFACLSVWPCATAACPSPPPCLCRRVRAACAEAVRASIAAATAAVAAACPGC